ncbi:hypothetical protein Cgig2_006244 [Carnegiea gigantea]|uniref:Uncharacterized protein n=1 Tax=Carnegiea gigantea TaxID=171969 RepID=A0A9Q1GMV8_9CARY|nr:hypothetical protein Cgig2_006244 [Carnegiea gigantea]
MLCDSFVGIARFDQPNSLDGVNKSYTTKISKEHVGVTNGMKNFATLGDGTINQVDDQNTPIRENTNTFQHSKQPNIPNSLEGVNKSYTTQISKERVGVTNGMKNFATLGDGTLNQVDNQNTHIRENTNTSRYSKQPNIVRRLNFDKRVQVRGFTDRAALT